MHIGILSSNVKQGDAFRTKFTFTMEEDCKDDPDNGVLRYQMGIIKEDERSGRKKYQALTSLTEIDSFENITLPPGLQNKCELYI